MCREGVYMSKLFDISIVLSEIPKIWVYLPVTMELAIVSFAVSLVFGLAIALVKKNEIPVLKQIASIFISIIRGTPIIVKLYVTYFGITLIMKAINLQFGTEYNVNGVPSIIYNLCIYCISIKWICLQCGNHKRCVKFCGTGTGGSLSCNGYDNLADT